MVGRQQQQRREGSEVGGVGALFCRVGELACSFCCIFEEKGIEIVKPAIQ